LVEVQLLSTGNFDVWFDDIELAPK